MAVGKVISAVLAVLGVVGIAFVGSHQVSIRSAASNLGRRLRSVSGRRLEVPQDMVAPLKFFEATIGPVIAEWSCPQWVGIYGPNVSAQGCPNSLIRASEDCDQGCQSALSGDPEFIRRRCPQTCHVAEVPSDTSAQDMTAPLGMFADTLPAEIAALSCSQWLAYFGNVTESGCQASTILASAACDDNCKGAFATDPDFARRRCPQTCNVQFPSRLAGNESAAAEAGAKAGAAMTGVLFDRNQQMNQLAMEVNALQQEMSDSVYSSNPALMAQLTDELNEKEGQLKKLAAIVS